MAEELENNDEEIMKNFILFRWIEVRRELRSRIDPSLIFSQYLYGRGEGVEPLLAMSYLVLE